MNTSQQLPATQNKAWGFWSTMKKVANKEQSSEEQANVAWPLAMTAISKATNLSLESVRVFLDSRYGRHFADDVQNELCQGQTLEEAINATTQQWMDWTINRQTSKYRGIERGMPYLTGFVIQAEIEEESLEEESLEEKSLDHDLNI